MRPGFEPRSDHVGLVVDKVAAEQVFFRVLRFPLPILIPPTTPHSSSIIWVWYNRPVVAAVPSGLSHLNLPPQKRTKGPNLVDGEDDDDKS
jgi:hypothetical protein